MKMLFASDSFKGSLTAVEICDLLQEAARWMRCFAQWAENG